jgi:serine/threonine protein kinase
MLTWENQGTHIVTFLGLGEEPLLALHIKYVTDGRLRKYLEAARNLSESKHVQVTRYTTSALAYLHGLEPPILHCDISDNSIFIYDSDTDTIVLKLADVGIPKTGLQLNDMIGTRNRLTRVDGRKELGAGSHLEPIHHGRKYLGVRASGG